MRVETAAFAAAFTLGIFGAGLATNAEDPPEVQNTEEIPVQRLVRGRAIRTGATGFIGAPGAGKIAGCDVSARIEGSEILVEVKSTKDAKLPDLVLVAYKQEGGGGESRMGPMLIEVFRAPIEARAGTTKLAIDPAKLAGAQVMVQSIVAEADLKTKGGPRPEQVYVLQVPEAEPTKS